ncbi:MAG: DUF5683 domain-containing protein [Bacteroidales bacterium]|nr:DUF5683 domain-containing protein [Bacteroidales bacterium]
MKLRQAFLILAFLMVTGLTLSAQTDTSANAAQVSASDSTKVAKHSPTTAMLLSIVPGGGQIYNKKYWKLPIVYGCLAASSYFIYSSATKMADYRNEFINRRDGNVELLVEEYAQYNDENIIELKNKYRRNMEISIGVTAIFYVLNIIDAMVDAHLYYFDISDDLSLRWSPSVMPSLAHNRPSYGMSLQFRF